MLLTEKGFEIKRMVCSGCGEETATSCRACGRPLCAECGESAHEHCRGFCGICRELKEIAHHHSIAVAAARPEKFCKHCGILLEDISATYCGRCCPNCIECGAPGGALCQDCKKANPAYARLDFGEIDLRNYSPRSEQWREPGWGVEEGRYAKLSGKRLHRFWSWLKRNV